MDNTTKFSGKGAVYNKARPSYSEDAIDFVWARYGLDNDIIIADIGSGTGKFTEQLLDKCSKIYAVEPNDDMRVFAENNLSQYAKFESVKGESASTGLLDNSVDLIVVAQAFHWFDVQEFSRECDRILRENGHTILIWNSKDLTQDITIDVGKVYHDCCPSYKARNSVRTSGEGARMTEFFCGEHLSKSFDNSASYDKEMWIAMNLSHSYTPNQYDENYGEFIARITAIFEQYENDGVVKLKMLTTIYCK